MTEKTITITGDDAIFVSDDRDECIRKTVAILTRKNADPLRRPDVKIKPAIIKVSIFLGSVLILFVLLNIFTTTKLAILVSLLAAALCLIVFLKRILVFVIHVYQRYAAESTRRRCCFTPSCSEYMLLAIDKYGAYRGFFKGVSRLFRCHYPNGGVDEP
ncbi:MAG: membrane protein insertion efficiency factor YidD [Oscillospiraceae bacterium]|jgi:putative membrane protein insertion efficiency factor|nr:membrane protein insertion efficiency factor YidD [Oscillospiraceae bacterium]